MAWTIDFAPRAVQDLIDVRKREGRATLRHVREDIRALADDPQPAGSIWLRRQRGKRRIYTADNRYRIVYRVAAEERILVERVQPREVVYRGLYKWGRDRQNPEPPYKRHTRRVRLVPVSRR